MWYMYLLFSLKPRSCNGWRSEWKLKKPGWRRSEPWGDRSTTANWSMGICVSPTWDSLIAGCKPDKMILKQNYALLAAEIEHVSNLFQEKQAELQSAVLRVDQVTSTVYKMKTKAGLKWSGCGGLSNGFLQLTQQLEDLKRGRLQLHSGQGSTAGSAGQKGSALSGPAALELRKLYQELQVPSVFDNPVSLKCICSQVPYWFFSGS